jgi:signal transduction histidine kinase
VATRADRVRSEVNQLAGVLLDDVERIAEWSVARMQELLPSDATVPTEKLLAVTLTNTRNLLEAVRDPDADPTRAEDHFRVSGETQVSQAIAADEMLQAWRIGLEVVREEAHSAARHLGIADDALLDFVEGTLQWGDVGMRESASAYREAEIRELERLAEMQVALRRVATLVAEGAPPAAVFDAVAAEMASLLVADGLTLVRYEPGDELTVPAHRGVSAGKLPAGTRVRHDGASVSAAVRRTQRPARMASYAATDGEIGEVIGGLGFRSGVGAPVVVDGRLWGATVANWTAQEPPPPGTEERMAEFARLLDTAIANADSRDQLTASRARLVTEAHEARRRVVRDLHDGAQQGLVHTIIALKLAHRALEEGQQDLGPLVSEALQYAEAANDELRELVHGILPSVLTREGLRAGVDELAARMSIPVQIDIAADRLPAVVEATAYFVVAGALTNVVKHACAERAEVRAFVKDETLHLQVRDDGVGGADPRGHGLVGLSDRVTALDGRLSVESPAQGGTILAAMLPLDSK